MFKLTSANRYRRPVGSTDQVPPVETVWSAEAVVQRLRELVPEPPGRELIEFLMSMEAGDEWESYGVKVERL